LQRTLEQCLVLGDDIHLRHWYTVLDEILPAYEPAFDEVRCALDWVGGSKGTLDSPLPTAEEPGLGGDAVARQLAHYLGQLADITDLSPWLTEFRDDLLALSERYWSGLFHCYNIVGLPPTNNEQESLTARPNASLGDNWASANCANPCYDAVPGRFCTPMPLLRLNFKIT